MKRGADMRIGKKIARKMIVITLAVAMVWTLVLGNIAVTANASVTTGIIKSVSTLDELKTALADPNVAEVVVTRAINLTDVTVLDGKGKTVRIEKPNITEMGTLASGGSDYRVFNIVGSANVQISNMTIIGGSSSNMGAVYVNSSAKLTMEHVTVTRSYRGVEIKNATVIMKDCNIVRNIANYGGGILCNGGTLIMDTCSLSENRSTSPSGGGGAMEIKTSGKLYANNVIIANNCSSEIGGAINNYGSSIYLMNSTVTGNVTTMHSYGARAGAGIGVNSSKGFYAVNCYLADNYYINNSTLTNSDIGLWNYSNPATLINCVYNTVATNGTASQFTETNCKTDTVNSATGYRNDGILSGSSGTTASFKHPILLAKEPNALYVPVSSSGSAASGGVDTYFDYSDPAAVKMSYGAENTPLASVMSAADTTYKVTKFYEGGERQAGVIGASIPSDAIFYTVKLGDVSNGSVDGATRYGDSYQYGASVTLQANADSNYAFKCWKDGSGMEVSTANPYTFTVDSDVTLVPEFASHTHQWSYVKNGECVIEAYCTTPSPQCSYYGTAETHENTLKLELSVNNAIYTGNSYQGATVSTDAGFPGTVSTNDIKYFQITTDSQGAVTENLLGSAPVNVGSYKAKITVGSGENSQTLEAAFQITPKTITDAMVTLNQDEFVISGSEQGPTVTVADGTALTLDQDYTVTGDDKQTARGTYTVIVEGKGNYTGCVTKTWKICYPSIPSESVTEHDYTGPYDGNAHHASVSVRDLENVTITYSKTENGRYQAEAPSFTNAGSYVVYYKIEMDGREPRTGTLTVTIAPGATHGVTVVTSENGTAGAQVNGASVTSAGYGTEITLVATPNSGYRLKKWTVISGGAIEIAVSNNRFTMPDANVTVKAEYELIPSGSSGGSGGSGSSGGSDTPTKPASPTENYTIPVKNENTVQVEAKITDSKANVSEITTDTIDKVVKNTGTESKVDTITIDLSGAKQEVTGVILSKTTVETLAQATAEAGNGIETATVELSNATVILDNKTLETLADQANGSQIELVVADTEHKNLNTAQQTTLSNYQMATTFEAYFTSDGQRISDFKGGTAIVSIKFTPEAGKDVNFYHIVYISENGQVERYKTKYESGKLLFTTTHFSDYAVVYDTSEKNETQEQPKEEESDAEANVTLDTTFRKLHLAEAKATKKAVKVSWKKVTGADGYVLYGAPCNTKDKTYKMKKLAVIKNGSKITYTNKNLKAGTYYKYYIKAYKLVNGKKVWLAQSKVIHVTTSGGKYGNAKAVKVNKTKVTLKKGKSLIIKASLIAESKPIKQHVNIKFESTNTKIATVTKNGRIKAKKKGTCYIYVYAQNGVYKKIKVVVS